MSNKERTTNVYRITSISNVNVFPKDDFMYVDANPVIDMLSPENNDFGSLLDKYVKELARDHNSMIVWSKHTEEEVRNVIHRAEYQKYATLHGITSPNSKPVYKHVEDTIDKNVAMILNGEVHNTTKQIFSILEQYGTQIPTDDDQNIDEIARFLYTNYGGNYPDAKHIAIANSLNINNILTNDFGIARYPHLNIFGMSSTINRESNNLNPLVKPTDYTTLISEDDDEAVNL